MTQVEVRVNGQPELLSDKTVAALLARHDIDVDTKGVAVALNGVVLPRARWTETPLDADDRIEIVHARQGG
ncbi:sulfur carrier protein ThiS [Pseudochelatococcus contaminans]|uniref:Sulfur carrier protein n=1 Tax=Pseudochelatococcus contaminans TaxID=1538103 RepID=A0A7W5Z240_9HYPH|nr:sulfur carrier protein [Pseudochelatococcus contaminans]